MVLITLLSLLSFENMHQGFDIPYSDKIAHFIFHAVAALLGCLYLREQSHRKISMYRAVIIMVGALLLYGILIEIIQVEYTTTRSGEVSDVMANLAGALAGTVAVKVLYGSTWQLKW